jgi:hypothetical protein
VALRACRSTARLDAAGMAEDLVSGLESTAQIFSKAYNALRLGGSPQISIEPFTKLSTTSGGKIKSPSQSVYTRIFLLCYSVALSWPASRLVTSRSFRRVSDSFTFRHQPVSIQARGPAVVNFVTRLWIDENQGDGFRYLAGCGFAVSPAGISTPRPAVVR